MFDRILIVDWSARSARSPARPTADALWVGGAGDEPRYFRTRAEVAAWLGDSLAEGGRVLVGFDFPFGYPAGFAEAVTGRREVFGLWAHLAERVRDGADNANNRFEVAAEINARLPGVGPFWGRPVGLDLPDLPDRGTARAGHGFPERRIVEGRVPGAQSVWKLYTTGSVGGQALTGLPVLWRLRHDPRLAAETRVWPFETGFAVPSARIVFAEIYPSLLGRLEGPGIKDALQVSTLARAFARLDARGGLSALFAPDMVPGEREIAEREEGWILGVGAGADLRAAVE